MSDGILKLVELTQRSGLHAEEGQWSKALVYWVEGFMPDAVRAAGNADASLEYTSYEGSPHSPPDEGFIDREAEVAISFLLQVKEQC